MRTVIIIIVRILTKIVYRTKLIGKENIPAEGAAIICPNHVHAFDAPIIVSNTKRIINVLAKEELLKNKFLKWLASKTAVYPIKRDSADMHAIKTSLKLLKNKELLLIFPEGTRNGLERGLPVKNGPMAIAIKANVPIIPIGIKGSFKAFSKITINIGKPIYYDEYKDKVNDKEVVTKLTEDLMKEVVRLRDSK